MNLVHIKSVIRVIFYLTFITDFFIGVYPTSTTAKNPLYEDFVNIIVIMKKIYYYDISIVKKVR